MTYEVRIIYKDGTCAVFGNVRKVVASYESFILYYADMTESANKIVRHNTMKAIKIAIKEF